MMSTHRSLSDDAFEQQIEQCLFNPLEFTHEAHLRLAWVHIKKYGINQAIINVQKQLYQFVKNAGAEDKYNKTLTIAATKAVYHFILKSNSSSFSDLLLEYPLLTHSFKEMMESHYSINIFDSNRAKQEYIQPDLAPFY